MDHPEDILVMENTLDLESQGKLLRFPTEPAIIDADWPPSEKTDPLHELRRRLDRFFEVPWASRSLTEYALRPLTEPPHRDPGPRRQSYFRAPGPKELLALRELGLHKEVSESRGLLALEDDWDDQGSPGYAEATWNHVVGLLLRTASHLWNEHRLRLVSAEIMPGAQGAIDLDIRAPHRRMLLSVPAAPATVVRYYGHDAEKRNTTKGTQDTCQGLDWLLEWLAG